MTDTQKLRLIRNLVETYEHVPESDDFNAGRAMAMLEIAFILGIMDIAENDKGECYYFCECQRCGCYFDVTTDCVCVNDKVDDNLDIGPLIPYL